VHSRASLTFAIVLAAPHRSTLRHSIISALADPNLALLAVAAGLLCIYLEFCRPGTVASGAIGGILVLLGLYSFSNLPINWVGVALLALSAALILMDVKFAAHGQLAAAGALAMTFGTLMLVDSSLAAPRIRWTTAIGVSLPVSAVTVFLLKIAARAKRNKTVTAAEPNSRVRAANRYNSSVGPSGEQAGTPDASLDRATETRKS
jgi:membrane-bound serine protease (ClpP class)